MAEDFSQFAEIEDFSQFSEVAKERDEITAESTAGEVAISAFKNVPNNRFRFSRYV